MAYPKSGSVYGSDPWAHLRTSQPPAVGQWGSPGQYDAPQAATPAAATPVSAKSPYEQSPWLRSMLALIMQNAGARTAGARLSAQNAAPNDPSMAAYAGLQAQLGGQSDASGQMASAANSYYGQVNNQAFEEAMQRLRAQLEEEQAKRAAGNPLMAGLGTLVGKAAGSFMGASG